MDNAIYLTSNDYEYIKNNKKKIGEGSDGIVYYIGNNKCYKFYHHSEERTVSITEPILDNDGVNIRNYKDLKYKKLYNITLYYDKDGVKLSREMALIRAIERQKDISLSVLPTNLIYVDNRVMGCELKYIKSFGGIYLSNYFPLPIRKKICNNLIIKIKELIDNYIYPIDVSQRDKVNFISKNNANILLGLDMKPKLIDLDGKSTAYLEYYSNNYEKLSMISLNYLIMEIITSIDFKQDYSIEELEYIKELIHSDNISYDLIDKFYDSYLNFDELNSILDSYKRKLTK